MAFFLKSFIQNNIFQPLGYQIRQIEKGVSLIDSFSEQKRLLEKADVNIIFDIGSSDGRTSEKYHEIFPSAKIYAFEPNPKTFEKLVEFCKIRPYIIPINFAISDTVGMTSFNITALDDASSLLKPNTTHSSFDRYHILKNTLSVKTTTIDQFCKDNNITKIDLLKIDTQGAEVMVLNGAKETIERQKISLIYSECQFIRLYKDAAQFFEINSFLDQYNYRLFNLYNFSYNQKGQLAWGDCIFIPNY